MDRQLRNSVWRGGTSGGPVALMSEPWLLILALLLGFIQHLTGLPLLVEWVSAMGSWVRLGPQCSDFG